MVDGGGNSKEEVYTWWRRATTWRRVATITAVWRGEVVEEGSDVEEKEGHRGGGSDSVELEGWGWWRM